MRNKFCLFISTLALFTSVAAAESWRGEFVDVEGAVWAKSPGIPMEGKADAELTELWRIGGDTDSAEELFGYILRILADSLDNVYVLDSQLSEVRVFDSSGAYLRTIGRRGGGPGEFRRPNDMFFTSTGNLAVTEGFPARIVLLTRDGKSVDDTFLRDYEGTLARAIPSKTNFAVSGRIIPTPDNPNILVDKISVVDRRGQVLETIESISIDISVSNFKYREADFEAFQRRFAVGPDGSIYTIPKRTEYRINVWSSTGKLKRVIQREYESYRRTDEERQRIQPYWDMQARRIPHVKGEAAEFDYDARNVYPMVDGSLWVTTSHGYRGNQRGYITTFDIFDAKGRFKQQLTLRGEGNLAEDSIYFLRQRLYVVTQVRSSFVALLGGMESGEKEEEDEDPLPMTVICYDLSKYIARSPK